MLFFNYKKGICFLFDNKAVYQLTDELFAFCLGRKAVDIHHGNLRTDIVAYFVELGAV